MLTLVIVRHGQTEQNVLRRYQGLTDSPLTAVGREQARWLGERLASLAARPDVQVVSSDLGRAVETARIAFAGITVATDARLREMSFGRFEERTHEACLRADGAAYRAWLDDPVAVGPPGGEVFAAFAARVGDWLDEQPRTGTTLAVTHGGPAFVLLSRILGIPFAAARTRGLEHGEACRLDIATSGRASGPVWLCEETSGCRHQYGQEPS
jgi:broad specificity phosphatase PhoE